MKLKQRSTAELQDILFTAFILAAAFAALIYNAYRNERAEDQAAASTPADPPAATVEPEQTRTKFESVPPDVLLIQLGNSDTLRVTETSDDNVYEIACGDQGNTALLHISEKGGYVASILITFTLPAQLDGAPANAVEQAICDELETLLASRQEEIQTILRTVISGCDLNEVLQEPILRTWYEGAVKTIGTDQSYKNSYKSCVFTAAVETEGSADTLVVGVTFPV